MSLGRLVAKFAVALLLAGVGAYFLIGSDTSTSAQTAPPDYKVEWTATKFLVIDWEKLFYPNGGKGTFNPDPADSGAKQRLAIGVHEWKVIYSVKRDGCDQNIPTCYQEKYNETWLTGADPSISPNFVADNCYKVPANCDNSNPNSKYSGQWNWSFGSETADEGHVWLGGKSFRQVTDVGIADVTDTNLYANNSQIYLSLYNETNGTGCTNTGFNVTCWQGPRGFGPGFLEVYQCSIAVNGVTRTCKPESGFGGATNIYHTTYFYTSAPYSWQHVFKRDFDNVFEGATTVGTLSPTRWFVTGILYD